MSLIIPIRGSLVDRVRPLARDLKVLIPFHGRGNAVANVARPGGFGSGTNLFWAGGDHRIGTAARGNSSRSTRIQFSHPDFNNIRTDAPHTWLVWCMRSGTGAEHRLIRNAADFCNLHILSSDIVRYRTNSSNLDSVATIPANTWVCLAVTSSGSARFLYIDGVEEASDVNGHSHSALDYYIGSSVFSLYGKWGLVVGWQRALSAAEIVWLYRDPWAMMRQPRPMAVRQRQYARVNK